MKRSELIEKTISPALQFFSQIKRGDKVSIIHGHDLDSLCSASIIYTLAKDVMEADAETVISQFNFTVTTSVLETTKPKFTVFVDLAEIPQETIDRLSQFGKVLIIDHHPPKKYEDVFFANPRKYQPDIYMPTTYIAYEIFEKFSSSEKILTIACIGTLADHGAIQNIDIFRKLKKVAPGLFGKSEFEDDVLFKNSKIGELVGIFGSSEVVARKEGAVVSMKAMLKMKNTEEIFQGKFKEAKSLLKTRKIVEDEYKKVFDDLLKNRKIYGNIVFYEIKSHLNLKSTIAGSAQKLFKNKILAIAQATNDSYDVSFRRGPGVEINLGEFAKTVIAGIPNATGGGHEAAAAARIPKEYINKLIENIS